MQEPATFVLQGRLQAPQSYAIVPPPLFIDRESLVIFWEESLAANSETMALGRAAGALLGRCSGLGKAAKADWVRAGCDPRVYGGEVYSFLREQGCTLEEVLAAARVCHDLLVEVLLGRPTSEAIEKRAGESTPPPRGSTDSSSA